MNRVVRHITEGVAERHGVAFEDIVGCSRLMLHSRARQEAYYQVRQFDPEFYSFPQIARQFKRHHATVIYGINKHAERQQGKRVIKEKTG